MVPSSLRMFSFSRPWRSPISKSDGSWAGVTFTALHLVIRNGRAELGAPVDQVAAAVDEALPVEPDKDFAHGARKAFVQGKAGPAPVTRAAQLPELLENPLAVPLLPGPNPLEE